MAGVNIYGELVRAQLENVTAAPSSILAGRLAFDTVLNKVYLDNATTVRSFLVNDAYLVVGNNATANSNVRINRSAVATLQLLLGGDTTAEGSAAADTQLATLNAKFSGTWLGASVSFQTTTYAALVTDDSIFCSGSAFTVTLPAASVGKKTLRIQKTDTSLTNIITIARAGADTITASGVTGLTSTALHTVGECVELVSDGTSVWYVIRRDIPSVWAVIVPTIAGFGTVGSVECWWRRVGDSAELNYRFAAGTVSGTTASATLPGGGSVSSTKVSSSNTICGRWVRGSASANADKAGCILMAGSGTTVLFSIDGYVTASSPFTTISGGGGFSNSDVVNLTALVPISGWNS